jgi:hypothetical protein
MLPSVQKLKPGEAYVATKGQDFDCLPESFRAVVYDLAVTKGGGWQGTSTVVANSVVYAFFKRGDYMRPNLPAYPLVRKMRGEHTCDRCNSVATHCYREGRGTGHSEHVHACHAHAEH